jgi:hypothetical protein
VATYPLAIERTLTHYSRTQRQQQKGETTRNHSNDDDEEPGLGNEVKDKKAMRKWGEKVGR